MEFMGDTAEDAYILLHEVKEAPRCDWWEYFQPDVHRYEQHPMIFFRSI